MTGGVRAGTTDDRSLPVEDLLARASGDVVRTGTTVELPHDRWTALVRDEGHWGVGTFVTRQGGVLLVHEPGKVDDWFLPGGKLEAVETHAEGAVRETREETGLDVVADGLAAVSEQTFVDADTGRSFEWFFATFDATPTDTASTPEPGSGEDGIAAASWHETVPENTFDRDLVETLLARTRSE